MTPAVPAAAYGAVTRDALERDLLRWCNERLAPPGVVLAEDTPLFATRLVDSIRILELIAWVERAVGAAIPDAAIRMDNFRSVSRIAEVFGSAEVPDARA